MTQTETQTEMTLPFGTRGSEYQTRLRIWHLPVTRQPFGKRLTPPAPTSAMEGKNEVINLELARLPVEVLHRQKEMAQRFIDGDPRFADAAGDLMRELENELMRG